MNEVLETRFDVVRVLGDGSIGRVLLARERSEGPEVAVKVLSETLVHSREARLALRGEYLALARLRHPRVVSAIEYAEPAGQAAYYAMEFVPGPDLSSPDPPPARRARELLVQALEGLAFLHSRQTMHNDIRPENLRLGADGSLKVMGFGLSGPAGTRPDMARVNPVYAAPEVFRGARLDPRSDLFSLGAVFYRILTGREPFEFDRSANPGMAHLAAPTLSVADLRPDLPADLAGLVMRLLAGSGPDRPPSAQAALAHISTETSVESPALETAPGSAGVSPAATADRQDAAPPGPGPGLLLNPPLIGRSAHLAELAAALRDASAGPHRRLALRYIAGPRGSGRSHLLEEFAGEAMAAGYPVVKVDAREGVRYPYATLAAVLRRLPLSQAAAPDAATQAALAGGLGGLEPRAAQLRAQCAWADMFSAAAGDGLLVLAIDNADEADEASMALLKALGKRTGVPVFATAAVTGEVPDGEQGVTLDALDPAALAAAAAGMLGIAAIPEKLGADLHLRTAGNPGLLRTLLGFAARDGLIPLEAGLPAPGALDVGALPGTPAELGRKQLEGLPYPAWQMSEALAVSRGPQRFARLGQWLGLGDNAIAKAADALLAQGLLAIAPGGGRLADPDAVAALLADLPAQRQEELHSRIAAGIEQQAGGDESSCALADHLAGAGDTQRSATVAVRAAGHRLSLFCLAEADRMLGLAEKGARPGSAEQAAILLLRADQARLTGRFERAFAAYERALAEHPKVANRPDLWGGQMVPSSSRVLMSMAGCRQVAGRPQDALKLAFRAAQDSASEGNVLDLARAKTLLARLRLQTGDSVTAAADAAQALEAARRAGDPLALADAATIAGQLGLDAPEGGGAAVELLEEARALRDSLGDWVGLAECNVLLGKGLLAAGQYSKAIGSVERGLSKRRELGISRDDEDQVLLWVSEAAYELGSLGPALALALEIEVPAAKAGNKPVLCRAKALHARIAADLGRLAEALSCAEAALGLAAEVADPGLDLAVRTLVVPVWMALGDMNKVYELSKAALALAETHNRTDAKVALMVAAAEAALVEGDSYRATERLTEAQKLGGAVSNRGLTARLLLTAARQTLSRGNDEVAETTLAEARATATACGMTGVLAQAALVRAEILAHRNSAAEAARSYQQAYATALDLGMPLLAATAAHGLVQTEASAQAHRKYLAALDALSDLASALPEEARERFVATYIPGPEDIPEVKADAPPSRTDKLLADFGRMVAGALCGTVDLPGAGAGARGPHKALDWILDQIVSITGSERGLIDLRDSGASRAGRLSHPRDDDATLVEFGRPFLERCANDRTALCVADSPTGTARSSDRKLLSLDLHALMCLPLFEGEALIGLLYLDRRSVRGIYSEADLQLAGQLGVYAALAISVGRLRTGAAHGGNGHDTSRPAHVGASAPVSEPGPGVPGAASEPEPATEPGPARRAT